MKKYRLYFRKIGNKTWIRGQLFTFSTERGKNIIREKNKRDGYETKFIKARYPDISRYGYIRK